MKTPAQMQHDWLECEKTPVGTCIHCGKTDLKESEGRVCDQCYSRYTPGMLADLEG